MLESSLAAKFPDLAEEADGWDPTTVAASSNRRLAWRCARGHRYEAIVSNRSRLGRGCPYCSGRYAVRGENDLSTTHPDLARQAIGWDPSAVMAGSGVIRLWRCDLGHEYEATPNSRSTSGTGCPYCSGRRAVTGHNDLSVTHPLVAAQADGWDPVTVKAGSGLIRGWRCKREHRWAARVSSRVKGNGCPYCANKKVLAGFNDLTTSHPTVAAEALGWDPRTVLGGTHARRTWQCQLGHVWQASVANRAIHSQGCPFCSGRRVLEGFNDLAFTDPLVAAQATGWDPTTVTRSSSSRRLWRCDLGHEWTSSVNDRTAGSGTWCPYCAGRRVLKDFNDLAFTHPKIAQQAVGWDPSTVTHGSDSKRRWRCDQGHEWVTAVANRVGGKGCPTCATHGFDPAKPAWLYLYRHPQWGLLQIGITNAPHSRLKKHEKAGWVRLDVMRSDDGHHVRRLESRVKALLKVQGIRSGPENAGGKFDGYTESWREDDLSVRSVAEVLRYIGEESL